MKSMTLTVIALASVTATGASAAATPWPPAPVVQAAAQVNSDSDAPAPLPGKAKVRKWLRTGFIHTVRVSGNRQPDWLIDSGKSDNAGAWCGTGGCSLQIWAAGSDGAYGKVFDTQVREIRFHPVPGQKRSWIEADFHGSLCGLTGVEPCPWGFEWRDDGTGQMGLNASLRFLKAPILRPGGVPQAIDSPSDAVMPEAIRAFLAAQQAGCGQWQEVFPVDLVSRLPDVNGDGIDDWTYDGLSAYCTADEAQIDPDAAPADNPHADDDPCAVVACRSIAWLSQRQADRTVTWREAGWDESKLHAWRFVPGQPVQAIELSNRTGIAPGDDGECETFDLATCVQTPVPLTP